jgi:hypothetical protein
MAIPDEFTGRRSSVRQGPGREMSQMDSVTAISDSGGWCLPASSDILELTLNSQREAEPMERLSIVFIQNPV